MNLIISSIVVPIAIFNSTFFVPQRTWEDPTFFHPDAEGCRGDNDPVDVCEIGMRIVQPGVSDLFLCSTTFSYVFLNNSLWIESNASFS